MPAAPAMRMRETGSPRRGGGGKPGHADVVLRFWFCEIDLMIFLKGSQSKDTYWPKNIEIVQPFPSAGIIWWCC